MDIDKRYKDLRQRAENLAKQKDKDTFEYYFKDVDKLIEELHIHQIELEMQNNELVTVNLKLESEQNKYKALYMHAPVPYFTLNKTGNIIELNHAAAQLLNIPIHHFRFTSIFPYLEEHSKLEFSKYFTRVFNSGQTEYGRLLFVSGDDKLIETNLSASSYFDNEHKEQLVRCSVIDQTRLKKYEEELSVQKQINALLKKYETIYDSLPVGIGISNNEGRIVECNQALTQLLGYNQEEMLGKDIQQFNHPEDVAREEHILMQLSPENPKVRLEKRYIAKDKSVIWVDFICTVLYNEDGKPDLYLGIVTDITDQINNSNKLLQAKTELEANEIELRERLKELNSLYTLSVVKEKHNTPEALYAEFVNTIAPNAMQFPAQTYVLLQIDNQTYTNKPGYQHPPQKKALSVTLKSLGNQPGSLTVGYTDSSSFIPEYEHRLINSFAERLAEISQRFAALNALKDAKDAAELSESKYRLLSETITDGIALVEDNQIKYISGGYHRMLGYNHDELLDRPVSKIFDFIHPADKEKVMQAIEHAHHQQIEEFGYEYRVITKTGDYIWVEDRINATYDSQGKHDRSVILSRNVDDRKNAEWAMEEINARFRYFVNHSADLINIVDEDYRIAFVNPLHAKYNLPVDKAVGMYIWDYLQQHLPDTTGEQTDATDYKTKFQRFVHNNAPDDMLTRFIEKQIDTGATYFFKESVFKIPTTKGTKLGIIIADITQEKLQEQKLIQLNADKDRFMRILGHDLRSPFNTLLGFSSLLLRNLEKYDKTKIRRHVEAISTMANTSFNLLEDLLLWANSQSGRLPYKPVEFYFANLCNEIITENRHRIEEKSLNVNYLMSDNSPIRADVNMFRIIIRNLLTNAIKFTDQGGKITIGMKRQAQQIHVSVSDTGVGISKENHHKLWKMDEEFTTSGTQNEQGTGLGLLLCKEFVEKHGGIISVESTPGKGSSFQFTIPQ